MITLRKNIRITFVKTIFVRLTSKITDREEREQRREGERDLVNVPALNEMSSTISGCLSSDDQSFVVPRHSRRKTTIEIIWDEQRPSLSLSLSLRFAHLHRISQWIRNLSRRSWNNLCRERIDICHRPPEWHQWLSSALHSHPLLSVSPSLLLRQSLLHRTNLLHADDVLRSSRRREKERSHSSPSEEELRERETHFQELSPFLSIGLRSLFLIVFIFEDLFLRTVQFLFDDSHSWTNRRTMNLLSSLFSLPEAETGISFFSYKEDRRRCSSVEDLRPVFVREHCQPSSP